MLVGNKLDLADNHSRKVTTAEGQSLAEVRLIWLFKHFSAVIHSKPQDIKKNIRNVLSFIFLLVQQYQALFYECSAKTGENMEKLIDHLAG